MRYDTVKVHKAEDFRRLTGVKHQTFEKMVRILKEEEKKKKAHGAKPNLLSMEDRLLMALEYIREYRAYFHVSRSYAVSESTCHRTIRWIEETLVRHPDFALPGRKALKKSGMSYDVILIDATETPVERPKKSREVSIPARRKGTL